MDDIEKALAEAREKAAEELALLKLKEEARQAAVKAEQKLANERANRRAIEAQEAEDARLREEAEERLAVERELHRKEAELVQKKLRKEEIERKREAAKHTIELAKKFEADAKLPRGDADNIMENPLKRFLIHTPE